MTYILSKITALQTQNSSLQTQLNTANGQLSSSLITSGTPFYLWYNSGNANFPNSKTGPGIITGYTGNMTIDGVTYTSFGGGFYGAMTEPISFSSSAAVTSGLAWGVTTSSYASNPAFPGTGSTTLYDVGSTSNATWNVFATSNSVKLMETMVCSVGDRVGWSSYPMNRGWNWGLQLNGPDTGYNDFTVYTYGFGWSSQTGKNEYQNLSFMLPWRGSLKYYQYVTYNDSNYPMSASVQFRIRG